MAARRRPTSFVAGILKEVPAEVTSVTLDADGQWSLPSPTGPGQASSKRTAAQGANRAWSTRLLARALMRPPVWPADPCLARRRPSAGLDADTLQSPARVATPRVVASASNVVIDLLSSSDDDDEGSTGAQDAWSRGPGFAGSGAPHGAGAANGTSPKRLPLPAHGQPSPSTPTLRLSFNGTSTPRTSAEPRPREPAERASGGHRPAS